jgi:hypothetical protein
MQDQTCGRGGGTGGARKRWREVAGLWGQVVPPVHVFLDCREKLLQLALAAKTTTRDDVNARLFQALPSCTVEAALSELPLPAGNVQLILLLPLLHHQQHSALLLATRRITAPRSCREFLETSAESELEIDGCFLVLGAKREWATSKGVAHEGDHM